MVWILGRPHSATRDRRSTGASAAISPSSRRGELAGPRAASSASRERRRPTPVSRLCALTSKSWYWRSAACRSAGHPATSGALGMSPGGVKAATAPTVFAPPLWPACRRHTPSLDPDRDRARRPCSINERIRDNAGDTRHRPLKMGTVAKLGVRRPPPLAGVGRWSAGISARNRCRACRCRGRSGPGAADRPRAGSSASAAPWPCGG